MPTSARLAELERKVGKHDSRIKDVFVILHKLREPPTEEEQQGQIGFGAKEGVRGVDRWQDG